MKTNIEENGTKIELDTFIVGQDGIPVSEIQGRPASEFIHNELSAVAPEMTNHLKLHESAVLLQLSSTRHLSAQQAIDEALALHELINSLLKDFNLRLLSQPVSKHEFSTRASSDVFRAPAESFFRKLSASSQGRELIRDTEVGNLRFDISTDIVDPSVSQLREITNLLTSEVSVLSALDGESPKSFLGKTRAEHTQHFWETVLKKQLRKAGLSIDHGKVLTPPIFENDEDFQMWDNQPIRIQTEFDSTSDGIRIEEIARAVDEIIMNRI